MSELTVSGTTNAYATQSYTVESNDKNTLTLQSYFELLAAQIANQDMTDPMSNSEMMSQMVQMAMVQSLSTMTEAMETSTTIDTQIYAAGLIGQEVTMVDTNTDGSGTESAVGVIYGKVVSVDLSTSNPTICVQDDDGTLTYHSLSHLMGMGRLDDPYSNKTEDSKTEDSTTEDTTKDNTTADGTTAVV